MRRNVRKSLGGWLWELVRIVVVCGIAYKLLTSDLHFLVGAILLVAILIYRRLPPVEDDAA